MFKIYLRDINLDIVEAWKKYFINTNVDIKCESIFNVTPEAIVSPANSFGFMDGGIDLLYSKVFGWQLQQDLQKEIKAKYYGELPVGQAIIIPTKNPEIPYLISAPTMRVPEDVSQTLNAYLAFRAVLIAVKDFNLRAKTAGNPKKWAEVIASIACPGLGTLTGNLSPESCAKQMFMAYKQIILEEVTFPNSLLQAYSIFKDV